MKIVYVAKHNTGMNDDEGSILDGLKKLGHEVEIIRERKFNPGATYEGDFMLVHHFLRINLLERVKIPKVFWCFDLITYPQDESLGRRNKSRVHWIKSLTDVCDMGVMSDGDWVNKDTTGKLHTLRQGADQRIIGTKDYEELSAYVGPIPIMFMGRDKGGIGRETFVALMHNQFKDKFVHIKGAYRHALAKLIDRSQIVVAPDHPATDHYWSNRVYMALGFGALLLHPRCSELEKEYENWAHIAYYDNREDLVKLIKDIRSRLEEFPDYFASMRQAAVEETKNNHTYYHRCQKLIELVEGNLL